jgi:hypothetical protein
MKQGVIVLNVILLIATAVLYMVIMAKAKGAKKHTRTNLAYLGISGLIFAVGALCGFAGLTTDLVLFFVVLQAFALIAGILHAIFFYKVLPWTWKNKFLWEFFFTILIAFFGMLLMELVFTFLIHLRALHLQLLSSVIWFFVPFLFRQAWDHYTIIPATIFKKWYYPVGQDIPDPSDSDLAALVVVSFDFHKKILDNSITSFRAKAPQHMVFGRLFYYFINDYNDRHPESTIEFLTPGNTPYGWVFFHKPKWYRRRRYIDPDEIIVANRIRENSVIVCVRSNETNHA